ncbi:MAG: sulfocyanin-like copper-binding protein [Ilumatobacteraceae bacterium]
MTLATASMLTIGAAADTRDQRVCSIPALAGRVVDATLTDGPMTGGPMMNAANGQTTGAMMRLSLNKTTVARGNVRFIAINAGNTMHELLVLPLAPNQIVGTRAVGADARIDENGSLGEASRTCAAGSGDGIASNESSWVTISVPAGRYELVCNLPRHYAAGMYAQLTVV